MKITDKNKKALISLVEMCRQEFPDLEQDTANCKQTFTKCVDVYCLGFSCQRSFQRFLKSVYFSFIYCLLFEDALKFFDSFF